MRDRDLAVGYALVVVASAIIVFAQPNGSAATAVLNSSTNLHNLRTEPIFVLFVSAFVISSLWGLLLLPVLVGVFGAAQRWLGRAATVLVAVFGHVFATVFVGVLLNAGIANHQLNRNLARQPDVGSSYALASLAGLLVFRLPPATRRIATLTATAALIGLVVVSETFTDLGHLVAWGIGLAMGFVGTRLAAAAR
jgi:hypothetical protein